VGRAVVQQHPGAPDRNDLTAMQSATVTIHNASDESHVFRVWLALTSRQQLLGMMNVRDEEVAADQGMLFVFDRDEPRGFWMRNTILPLDIAYIRSDGTVVRTLTMQPFDERLYPSIEPARFALEVRAGELAARGIKAGDRMDFPAWLLNPNG
jgi:uncharacterized membrane protein (UPF0127 family)